MSDENTLQQLLKSQAHFGLPSPALVEKGFHLISAPAAIATTVEAAQLQSVFGVGPAYAELVEGL